MKLAVTNEIGHEALELQRIYDVTLISDKGLVFMHRDEWQSICKMITECSDYLMEHVNNPLADRFCLWSECFIVACDESEDYSCHGICSFELFSMCCLRCNIVPVLLHTAVDLNRYVNKFNAHKYNDVLGCYVEERGDILIEVEDN